MFEKIRQSMRDALAAATPGERRAVLAEMKETLVHARLGLDDLRRGLDVTRQRLGAECRELETVRRRRALAAGIGDTETVAIAERFEAPLAERVSVLGRKLAAQEEELALAEREVAGMTSDLRAAAAGVAGGTATVGAGADDPLRDTAAESLEALARERTRADRDAAADDMLAALKRRMGH